MQTYWVGRWNKIHFQPADWPHSHSVALCIWVIFFLPLFETPCNKESQAVLIKMKKKKEKKKVSQHFFFHFNFFFSWCMIQLCAAFFLPLWQCRCLNHWGTDCTVTDFAMLYLAFCVVCDSMDKVGLCRRSKPTFLCSSLVKSELIWQHQGNSNLKQNNMSVVYILTRQQPSVVTCLYINRTTTLQSLQT